MAHFQAVAARSPVPLVVYNIPYRTGRGLGAQALLELAATDGIVGLKQAVGALDVDTLQLLAQRPRTSPCCAATTPSSSRSLLMGGARRDRRRPRTCAPSASPR